MFTAITIMLAIENTRQTHGKLLSKPNVSSLMNSLVTLNSLSLFSVQGQSKESAPRSSASSCLPPIGRQTGTIPQKLQQSVCSFPHASTKSPSKTAKFCRGACAKAYTLTAFSGICFKTIINYISCLCEHKMFFSRLEVEVGEQEDQAQPGDRGGSERKQDLLHPPDCSGFTQTMMYSP